MKAYKILLFIISVMVILGLMCSFFPREGVQIGKISLEFPSIDDILIGDDLPEATITPSITSFAPSWATRKPSRKPGRTIS